MEGLTVIETPVMLELLRKLEVMSKRIEEIAAELKETKKPYLNTKEVIELIGLGKTWLNNNKQIIGFSSIGGQIRYKRKDVEIFIEGNYFKAKTKKRYF